MATIEEWLETRDPKYQMEARSFLAKVNSIAPDVQPEVKSDGIVGFGSGADGYFLLAFTVRKDGLRMYANVRELAKHKEALGRKLTGKSCVTLKKVTEIDDELLTTIVKSSLAARAMAE